MRLDPAFYLKPGTTLLCIFEDMGTKAEPDCPCHDTAAWMDELGPDGCLERFEEIRAIIAREWATWGWKRKMLAVVTGTLAVIRNGVVLELRDPTDPVRSFIHLAIDISREEVLV